MKRRAKEVLIPLSRTAALPLADLKKIMTCCYKIPLQARKIAQTMDRRETLFFFARPHNCQTANSNAGCLLRRHENVCEKRGLSVLSFFSF